MSLLRAITKKINSREPSAAPCFVVDQDGSMVRVDREKLTREMNDKLQRLERVRPEYFKHSLNPIS